MHIANQGCYGDEYSGSASESKSQSSSISSSKAASASRSFAASESKNIGYNDFDGNDFHTMDQRYYIKNILCTYFIFGSFRKKGICF